MTEICETMRLGKNHQLFIQLLGFNQKIKGKNHVVFRNKEHIIIDLFLNDEDTTKTMLRSFFVNYIKLLKVNYLSLQEIQNKIPIKENDNDGNIIIFIGDDVLTITPEWYNTLPKNDLINKWWMIFDYAFNFDNKI
ncbi:hypothetical protein EHI8A_001880 [Entamoeba histolytica HM-1:IMSS-B]|uniref:Uncharacterized protein n=6 Tax=Entamoeba histolytica TaxID=5759 RepID=C4LU74_ENTH1|nr:hypothetical protein EHI_110200 [Entamoeba histolytica HM-1:IMSS]EMD46401.1 Hypothetical protein EHI5A_013800 [Entamoeba histolytica KU27]EMH75877.1 hypothetical protein EHI8A_001880 [Entamoeba histolytica HM-1:IMSS-B]EMS16608.1 hypothetical protein KM1_015080 [Entamoeba histolytica HM-3:IMSS]ENY62693.1 hypothetical protein EHI7A_004110 [Entamoeba histolytica HM-1:IMSS-A]GAT92146.1 hypothetical protein CL6EHI_110200 [Entamoeba histolytica]|eukprot:XP_657030.1 hypothetical protein EHI_110200 [Entamoeba histolytica HM-1:IMSS]